MLPAWSYFTLMSVSFYVVHCPPGVTEVNRTYCFRTDQIHLDQDCDNILSIGTNSLGRVCLPSIKDVRYPFRLHQEGVEVLEPVAFTHQSRCHLDDDKEMEKITNYKPENCNEAKPVHGSATASQGTLLTTLVAALVSLFFQ